MKERALLENKITDVLAKHDVRLVRLEMSEYFGEYSARRRHRAYAAAFCAR